MRGEYDDIINLNPPEPKNRKRMPLESRAAQFAPFAALTGYESAIDETSRITEERRILDESEIELIEDTLYSILNGNDKSDVKIIYFKEDAKKEGGQYLKISGRIKSFDEINNILKMESGEEIIFSDIYELDYV